MSEKIINFIKETVIDIIFLLGGVILIGVIVFVYAGGLVGVFCLCAYLLDGLSPDYVFAIVTFFVGCFYISGVTEILGFK
jgi:hypothetical protein